MECEIVTPVASDSLPESLSIIKTGVLRVEHTADDTYITSLLQEAAEQITERTNRQILTASRALSLCEWWSGALELPYPKLQSVTHVKYYDADDVLQTLDPSNYVVTTHGTYGRITLTGSTPSLSSNVALPVIVTYVCGYGTTPASMPPGIKTAVRELAKVWYEANDLNRFTVAKRFPQHVDALLDPFVLEKIC